jgi:hypothetical protein
MGAISSWGHGRERVEKSAQQLRAEMGVRVGVLIMDLNSLSYGSCQTELGEGGLLKVKRHQYGEAHL